MTTTQSVAIESNANNVIHHIDYSKALSAEHIRELQDTALWLDMQEEMELDFIREETLNKGRAYANNHQDSY